MRGQPLTKRALDAIRGRMGGFALAGGTALALYYLRHRRSDDIDLFLPRPAEGWRIATLDLAAGPVLEAWRGAGIVVRPGIDHVTGEGVIGRRFSLLRGTDVLKADLVGDPVPRLAPPEDSGGVQVLGIDDIYLRKILIGASGPFAAEPRIEGRDLLDIHALSTEHHPFAARLTAMRIEWRAVRALQGWLDRFTPATVGAAIRETGYRIEKDPGTILAHVREELRRAAAAMLKGGR